MQKTTDISYKHWMTGSYEKSLVSVIVPTYNRADMLLECMESVWRQKYRPIELIVVDDGSTDCTKKKVKLWRKVQLENTHSFTLRYIYKENGGVSSARNRGLCESTGGFIQFLDSDDILLPLKLKRQVYQLLYRPFQTYAYSKTVQMNMNGEVYAFLGSPIPENGSDNYIPDHNWHISGTLYVRGACVTIGPFNEALARSNDWEYAARAKEFCGAGIFGDRVLSVYRIHQGYQNVKSGLNRYAPNRERALDSVICILNNKKLKSPVIRRKFALKYLKNSTRFIRIKDFGGTSRCLLKAILCLQNNFRILLKFQIKSYL